VAGSGCTWLQLGLAVAYSDFQPRSQAYGDFAPRSLVYGAFAPSNADPRITPAARAFHRSWYALCHCFGAGASQ